MYLQYQTQLIFYNILSVGPGSQSRLLLRFQSMNKSEQ